MIYKKKGNIGINKIMIGIIVILVVGSVLIFLFRANILEYLRALPGYSYGGEGDELVDGADELIEEEAWQPDFDLSEIEIQEIKLEKIYGRCQVDFSSNEITYVDIKNTKYDYLYLSGTSAGIQIYANDPDKLNGIFIGKIYKDGSVLFFESFAKSVEGLLGNYDSSKEDFGTEFIVGENVVEVVKTGAKKKLLITTLKVDYDKTLDCAI